MNIKKYVIKKIEYDRFDFCITYIDDYEEHVFWEEMHEDFYNELKSGKQPKYLLLDTEDIDSEYWQIEYEKL